MKTGILNLCNAIIAIVVCIVLIGYCIDKVSVTESFAIACVWSFLATAALAHGCRNIGFVICGFIRAFRK